MSAWQKMTGLAVMLCLLSTVSCSTKLDPNLVIGESSLRCDLDCVVVTKGFIKEHAKMFDQLIRTKAALKMCQEKKR
jgi:hypothetical protein